MVILVALMPLVAGCFRKPEPTIRTVIVRPEIPASAKVPCRASSPPDRQLTASEALRFWSADRVEVARCDARRAAAVKAGEGR
jgi:hypothetical protein